MPGSLLRGAGDDQQHGAVDRDPEVQAGPQPVQPEPAQPRVLAVVSLAELLEDCRAVGQAAVLSLGAAASLAPVDRGDRSGVAGRDPAPARPRPVEPGRILRLARRRDRPIVAQP
jgi:hypothetical protein